MTTTNSRSSMENPNPKLLLDKASYKNYRNIRAVALLYVLFATTIIFTSEKKWAEDDNPVLIGVTLPILTVSGIFGGLAVRAGNRRWSPIIYLMAIFYL